MISVPASADFPVLADLSEEFSLDPTQFWGIPVALVGAALLAFGAQFQSRGLNKVERMTGESAGSGLSLRHLFGLMKRPSWVFGTLFLGLATVFQIISLGLSPLIVVQPVGVVALVITALLNRHYTGVKLGSRAKIAVTMCVVGISAFVTIAAFNATDKEVTDQKLIIILILFAVVFVGVMIAYLILRKHAIALLYIVGAGVLYGFVATFAKTVIGRFQQNEFDWLTWVCVAALLTGAAVGLMFVQNAYSSGPPDLVVAGLTVIDPLIAVVIGIVVLGEAAYAAPWAIAAFIVSGAVAMFGVYGLARYHPQTGMTAALKTTTGGIPVMRD